ncbi:MAG: T9SS type A sorting domain-containing protein [Bacteroidales bacterium]|nr:T9SS type A sorting domain-containing protein [Bacteroidales bacterium]
MKYVKIFLLFTSLIPYYLIAQDWIRTYTSTQGGGYGARWVIESYDKGYIILGDAYNYKYGLILKTDINGYEQWHKYFGNGSYHNVPVNIEQTLDSGYIVAGTMSKYGTNDAFLLKLNACFEKEWCKVLYTANYYPDYGRRVKPLPDGGYLLLTAYYEGITPGTRIHLHKFDPNGNLIWQQAFARSDSLIFNEEGFDLSILNSNDYLVTGTCYYPDSGQTGGRVRPFLIKSDSSGNCIWETPWTMNDTYWGKTYKSAVDNAGNSYGVGYRKGSTGQYPAMIKTGNDGQELFFSDLNDTSYFGQGQTITFMEDSNLFIALGWRGTNEIWQNGFMKTDTLGNVLDYHGVVPISHALISTARTFDNKFITVGIHKVPSGPWVIYAFKLNSDLEYDTLYTEPFDYDWLCPYGITSDTTDMDCDILVMVDEKFVPLEEVKLQLFPNPARDKVTIRYPDITRTGQREIRLVNSLGVEVKRRPIPKGEEEIQADLSGLSPGIYFAILLENGKMIASGKLMVVR